MKYWFILLSLFTFISALTDAERQHRCCQKKKEADPDYNQNQNRERDERRKSAFSNMSPAQKAEE